MADALRLQITADSTDAVNQIHLVVDNTKELETALSGSGAAGLEAGEEISSGMQKAEYSTMEARHAAMMLGEETGVHIPRALSGLISRSETLGPIMARAFSGIAVMAFAELAVKAGEKLGDWISNTFIFTQAEKDLNTQLLASNKQIEEYATKTEALGRAFELIGEKGSKATDIKIQFNVDDILKAEATLRAAQDQMYKMRNEGDAGTPEYGKLADQAGVLQAKLTMLRQENQNLVKEDNQQQEAEAVEANNKRFAIEEKMDQAVGHARQQLIRELEAADKENSRIDEERLAAGMKAEQKAAEDAISQQERQLKGYITMTENEVKAIESSDSAKEHAIENEFKQRKISGDQYLASLSTLYNSEVNALVNALNQEEDLYVTLAKDEAAKRGEILTDEEVQESSGFQALENKKLEIQQNFINKYTAAEKKMQADQDKTLQQGLGKMNTEFSSTFANIEMGHERMGQGAIRMYDQMATSFLKNMAITMLAEMEGALLHKTLASQKQLSDAKGAAAGAWNATADIPVIGPVLAPIAAATAFAGVMAFDEGGMVPQDQMSYVHADEGVLTAPQVDTLRKAADNMGDDSAGGDTHHHWNINAMDARNMQDFAKRNPDFFAAGVKNATRNGHLSVSDLSRGK